MHINNPHSNSSACKRNAVEALLREAKMLHRAATSNSHSRALPVLRRLLNSKALTEISLVELRRHQDIIQRKHILHMLALEAGFSQWADYRREINDLTIDQLEHHGVALSSVGYPNLWCSSMDEARAYAAENGGRVVAYGSQAVVLTEIDP